MRIRTYIVLLSMLLMSLGTVARAQTYVAVVCSGDTGISFMVEGWENSTFNWSVEGGIISRDFGDSILVDWLVPPGEYGISVQD